MCGVLALLAAGAARVSGAAPRDVEPRDIVTRVDPLFKRDNHAGEASVSSWPCSCHRSLNG